MQRVFEKIIEKLKEKKTHETFCDKEVGFNKGIRMSIEIVNQVAEEYVPEINVGNINHWIPVKERLPIESLDSVIGWDAYRQRCCFVQYYGGRWRLPNNDVEIVKIIAWQPLPKAYREDECKYGKIAIVGGGRNAGRLMKQQIALLEELESYRTIGTLQECKEAITKSQEMKLFPPKESPFTYKGICPVCGNHILLSEKYCSQCGQKVGVVQR